MDKRKDITVQVPTAKAKLEALPPKIVTTKKFWRWNWKYISATWILTLAIASIGCFLPQPLCLVASILLSIIPFLLGTKAITKNTIKEITN